MNFYAFVVNDGIGFVDILGLDPFSGDNPKAAEGRQAHREFGPGTKLSPNNDGKGPITDKFIDHGTHVEVQELKPNDALDKPNGPMPARAEKQLEKQMEAAHDIHKKPVKGTVWGWCKDACGKRYTFVKKKGVKWIGKKVPGVGIVVSLVCVGADIEAKGVGGGLCNTGLDAIPFVGTCKGVVEVVIAEDLIDDK